MAQGQNLSLQDKKDTINAVYNLYLQGEITTPSNIFYDTSLLAGQLENQSPNEGYKTIKNILEAYAFYVSIFEGSQKIPKKEIDSLLQERIDRLTSLRNDEKNIEFQASILYISGLLEASQQHLKKAEHLIQESLDLEPQWAYANLNMGVIKYYLGDLEEAEELLQKTIMLDPTLAQTYYYLGWIYVSKSRENEALLLANKGLIKKPKFTNTYNLISVIQNKFGNNDESADVLKKLIKLAPNDMNAYSNLAWSLTNMKKYDEAILWLKKGISINPYYSELYMRLGEAYKGLNKIDSTKYYFNKCNELDGSCYDDLGWLKYFDGKFPESLNMALKSIEFSPYNSYSYNFAGWSSYKNDNFPEAVKYFEDAVNLDPRNTSALRGLAYTYQKLGQLEEAGIAWEKSMKVSPISQDYINWSTPVFMKLATGEINNGHPDEALKWLKKSGDLGNKYCKLLATGLMHELGLKGTEIDFSLALKSYKGASERYPYLEFVQNRIVSLYENGSIPMDTIDYSYWKDKFPHTEFISYTYHKSCIDKDGNLKDCELFYFLPVHPYAEHPVEWEYERLEESYELSITKEKMRAFEDIYRNFAQVHDLFFPVLMKYINLVVNKKEYSELKNELQSLEETKSNSTDKEEIVKSYNELVELYKIIIQFYKEYKIFEDDIEKVIEKYGGILRQYILFRVENLGLENAEDYVLEHTQNDLIREKSLEVLAKIQIEDFENNLKENQKTNFRDYLTTKDILALTAYFDHFKEKNDEEKKNYFLEQIIKSKGDSPEKKFKFYKSRKEEGLNLFKDLYLSQEIKEVKKDISFLLKRSRSVQNNQSRVEDYELIVGLDDHLLSSTSQLNKEEISQHYNSLAWYQLLTGEFESAEKTLIKGINIYEGNLYFYTNLPPAILLQGRFEEAKKLYLELKDKPFPPDERYSTFEEVFLDDIKTFKAEKIIPQQYENDVHRIVELLDPSAVND